MSIQTRPSELALPVRALAALRSGLVDEVGVETAARALRQAGSAAGESLLRTIATAAGLTPDADPAAALAALPQARFWSVVNTFFQNRGWGRLEFSPVHEGVGALDAIDWVESNAEGARPSCFLSTGLLAGLLGRISGQEVAVLEVECRSAGDHRCRFLFGSPEALEAVYADIAAGRGARTALETLA